MRAFLILIFSAFYTTSLFAQEEVRDYSFLKFEPLFQHFKEKEINIISADKPDLYFEVFSWLGTPYRWGGRTHAGIDCSDFVSVLYEKIYHKNLTGAVTNFFDRCNEIDTTTLVEGDLVFFNIRGKFLSHVGIYLQNGRFAHATVHGGVMINSLQEKYYKNYFYKAGRLRE